MSTGFQLPQRQTQARMEETLIQLLPELVHIQPAFHSECKGGIPNVQAEL